MTELARRMHALRDAFHALLMLLWVVLLAGLAIYVVTSPITLTLVLLRMAIVGCR